ncbi:hypothetical protein [Pseudomonas sp. NFPP24]|uniref:hypothetical protein n=1 Tax=Pseudomonas sp. NFPP24 TaxID=1566228 RepID=UPI000B812FBA|nr:hypothetical protein [Pseudomonas sp. NFPP24]
MDTSLFVQTVIASVISGGIVAWLFASPASRESAAMQIRKIRSFGFKVAVLVMAAFVMARSAYGFATFATSNGPVSRIEVIELFVYFMNFFAFLCAGTLFAALWRATVLKERAEKAKPSES